MNLYTTPTKIRTLLNLSSSITDALLELLIEGVSRSIDRTCLRHFYAKEETKQIQVLYPAFLFVPDLLRMNSISSRGSTSGDATALTVANYVLYPMQRFPKVQLKGQPLNNAGFFSMEFVDITGLWGYGDGDSAAPWATSLPTIDSLSSSATTKVLTSVDGYEMGNTFLLTTGENTEQIYITNIDTLTITMERGVNGTTAIAHTDATVQRAKYPPELIAIVNRCVSRNYVMRDRPGVIEDDMDTLSHVFEEGVTLSANEVKALKGAALVRNRF